MASAQSATSPSSSGAERPQQAARPLEASGVRRKISRPKMLVQRRGTAILHLQLLTPTPIRVYLQHAPAALHRRPFLVLCEYPLDIVADLVKVLRRKREDGWAGTRQAHTQKTRMRCRREGGQNAGESGDKGGSVRLMQAVLHCLEDEVGVWR